MIEATFSKKQFERFSLVRNAVIIRINERLSEDEELLYCQELGIRLDAPDARSRIISTLVKVNYPADVMDAVRNNYDLVRDDRAGNKTIEYIAQYERMQQWRQFAKDIATEIIESLEQDS